MPNIIEKPNGTYIIRFATGKNIQGKYTSISKTFRPSRPNLDPQAPKKEMYRFIRRIEDQIENGDLLPDNAVPNDTKKVN